MLKSIELLKSKGIDIKIIELAEIPKTAGDVERLYGCPLHNVLKSLVFIGDSKKVIAVVSGDKKVNIGKLKTIIEQSKLRIAKPNEVKEIIGYDVGGVTPFCVSDDIIRIIDKTVFDTDKINIGSGKAEIGIELDSRDLKKIWDGLIGDISE